MSREERFVIAANIERLGTLLEDIGLDEQRRKTVRALLAEYRQRLDNLDRSAPGSLQSERHPSEPAPGPQAVSSHPSITSESAS